jgi:ribonuclease P protein component
MIMKKRLLKKFILRKNCSFQNVYRSGKSYANKMLVLYVLHNTAHEGRRIGFAAGKKLGCAVVRNRVKRLLREAYRLNQEQIVKDVDLIIVGRAAAKEAGLTQIERALLDLCRRAKVLGAK